MEEGMRQFDMQSVSNDDLLFLLHPVIFYSQPLLLPLLVFCHCGITAKLTNSSFFFFSLLPPSF